VFATCIASSIPAATAEEPAAAPAPHLIKVLSQGIPHSAFFGISFDGGRGVAVGGGGAIYESPDSGATWKPVQHNLTKLALLAVDRRGTHTIAVGQLGTVLLESSPGKWEKIDTGDEARLFSISVNSGGLAVAVGEFGKVLKSEDGGHTWSSAAPDWSAFADQESFGTGEPNMYSAHVSESGEITIAGEYGAMLRSNDRAATWQVLRPVKPGAATIFATYLVPAGQGSSFAVGQEGEMLHSSDGGASWAQCDMPTKSNFLGVTAAPDGHVVITGMRVMMQSRNAGMSWEPIEEGDTTTDWYQAVRTDSSTGKIIAVGHAGRIIQIGG
jgi:photosystem II stability/assembly factor-like uncharacterized protein